MKRFSGIFLTLTMIISMFIPMQSASAALGIKHEKEVSILSAFGIVPGYPDPSYKADDKVSQTDFVKYASALVGMDVTVDEAYVKDFGLSGSGNISVKDSVMVVMKVIGYDKIVGNYGNNYSSLAQSVKLMDDTGVMASSADELTKDTMAVMLYNALNIKALEITYSGGFESYNYSKNTVMEYYLDIYEQRGNINANNSAALSGYTKTGVKAVNIDNVIYYTGNTDAKDLIGYNVEFYYRDKDGEKTIVWVEPTKSTKTLVIYGEDIKTVSKSGITYFSGRTSKVAKLESGYTVIYNGESDTSGDMTLIQPSEGYNIMIDTDGDNYFDVIDVKDYKYYFVDNYNADRGIVNDYVSGEQLEFGSNDFDEMYIYKDGMLADTSAIGTGELLAVLESKGKDVIKIEVLGGYAEGQITAITDDTIYLSTTEFVLSSGYVGSDLHVGKYAILYLDKNNRVVRSKITEGATSQYGYIVNMYPVHEGADECEIKMLTANGTTEIYKTKSKISYNGTSVRTTTAIENLKNKTSDGTVHQLVTYRVNSDAQVVNIKTANTMPMETGSDEETEEFSLYYSGGGSYRKSNMSFNSKYLIDSNVPIFLVPSDGRDFHIENISYLTNKYTYDVSIYDLDEYMRPGAIVIKENMAEPQNLKGNRAFIVDKITTVYDEDTSESAVQLNGYIQGAYVSYILERRDLMDIKSSVELRDLTRGSVIQISTNSKGKIGSARILFDAETKTVLPPGSSTTGDSSYWEGGTSVLPDLYISYGKVTNRNTETIFVDDDGNAKLVTKRAFKVVSGVNVFICEGKALTQGTVADISVQDNLYVHENSGSAQDIVIYR